MRIFRIEAQMAQSGVFMRRRKDEAIIIERARQLIAVHLQDCGLLEILGSREPWVLAGGAIRDTLLTLLSGGATASFPDLDIIVSPERRHTLEAELIAANIAFVYNSYGELKVTRHRAGDIDIFPPPHNQPVDFHAPTLAQEIAANINFGLNAVAFAWPAGDIAVHPRWWSDYHARRIEMMLARHDLASQCIYAAALMVKLERTFGLPTFALGPRLRAEATRLFAAEGTELAGARAYIAKKIAIGRWTTEVRERFETFSDYVP